MSGESDEIFEGVTKFFPDEKFPDTLSPDQNFNPIFLSPSETFTQNFILQAKIKSKFFYPELQKLVLWTSNCKIFFELVKETNSFVQFSRVEMTKL